MTITEANAVNRILDFLTESPKTVTIQDVASAGAALARSAHKALSAGLSEAEWLRRWKAKVTP